MNRGALVYWFSALLAIAMAFGDGCSSSTPDIKLNLKPGKTYRTRMITNQDIQQSVMEQTMNVKQKMTQELTFAALEIDSEGNQMVRVTVDRIATDVEAGSRKMSYDSAQPGDDNNPMAKSLGAMAGQSFTVQLGQRGEVLAVTGIDSLVERMLEGMELPNEEIKQRARTQLQNTYGEESVRQMCGQLFGMYPQGPVSVGDKWNKTTEAKMLVPVTWEQAWSFDEVRDGKQVLSCQGVSATHSDDQPVEMGPAKVLLDVDGSQSSTLELDRGTGLVVGGSIKSSIEGQQKIIEGVPQLDGQTMQLKVEQEVIFEKI